jgi:hypothetical protein
LITYYTHLLSPPHHIDDDISLLLSLDIQHRILQSLHQILGILQRQAKRRLDAQHISKSTTLTKQQSSLAGQLHQLVGLLLSGLFGLLVLDQFDTDHETLASDVTDDPMFLGKFLQFS